MSSQTSVHQRVCILLLCCVHYLKHRFYALLYVILVLSAVALLIYVYSTGKGEPLNFVERNIAELLGFLALIMVILTVCTLLGLTCFVLVAKYLDSSIYESSHSYGKLEEDEGEEAI